MEESNETKGPDLDRIGLFKEMGYLQGYVPPQLSFNESASKGRQMMTNCTKSKAGNQDGYFDATFQRLFEGEGYADTIRMNRLYRLAQAKQNLASAPVFKYTNPTKTMNGKGTYFGTFAEYTKNWEYFSSFPREFIKPPTPLKNCLVNPGQKGTGYGYPNLTIGKFPPYFLEEEYEELKNAPRGERIPLQPRNFAPYRAGVFQQGYFDPNPFRTVEVPSSGKSGAAEEKEEKAEKKPFLPSSPAKKDGGMKAGCLSAFPEYESEPFQRVALVERGTQRYVNKQNQMFLPVRGMRPYPVKSIINKNVKKKVNSINFKTIKGAVYCDERFKKKSKKKTS